MSWFVNRNYLNILRQHRYFIIHFVCLTFSFSLLQNTQSVRSQDRSYFVAFCSKSPTSSSLSGHAFVALGKGDPFTCSVSNGTTECWGLYAKELGKKGCSPSSMPAAASFFIGEVPGCLYSDIRTDVDNVFVLRCNYDQYLKALVLVDKWRNQQYQLLKKDCLAFLIEMAELFKYQLKYPSRTGLENFPDRYVQKLKNMNSENEYFRVD
jgi:hypothetical protein